MLVFVAMVSALVNFWGENCAMRRKMQGKHLYKGRMIIPSAKMAYVASVERENCLKVRTKLKFFSCPHPTHSATWISHFPALHLIFYNTSYFYKSEAMKSRKSRKS